MEPQMVIRAETIHLLGDRTCAINKDGPPVPVAMIVPMLVKEEPNTDIGAHQDKPHKEMKSTILSSNSLFQGRIIPCSNEVDFHDVLTPESEFPKSSNSLRQSEEISDPLPLKITCVRSVAVPEATTSPRCKDDPPPRKKFAYDDKSSQERLSGLDKKITESLERLNEATTRKTNALLEIVSVQQRVAAVLLELDRKKIPARGYLPEEFS